MRLLARLNNGIAWVEGTFLSFFLLVMIVLAFLQVVMRNVFDAGLPWADTVVRQMVLWVGFLGAALATKLDHHITIDAVTKFLPERAKKPLAILIKLFAITVCLYLLGASLRFLQFERSAGEQFLHLFPVWWTELIIPATFILIPFHFAVGILNDAAAILKKGRAA